MGDDTVGAPRFGAFLFTTQFDPPGEAETLAAAVRYADSLERLGFDDVWVSEHHFIRYGLTPSATTLAAFLLGRTTRLRVGTAVVLLPQHPPVFVAEQAALLDHVSEGRFDLGVGRGGPVVDLTVAGRALDDWSTGYWGAVDTVRRAWTGHVGGPDDPTGLPPLTVRPTPRTGAAVPMLCAVTSDASVEQAARRGIPMLLFLHETDGTRRAKVDRWAAIAAEHGHPTGHPGHAFALLGHATGPGESLDPISVGLTDFFLRAIEDYTYLPGAGDLVPRLSPDVVPGYVENLVSTHPVGPPEVCVQRLAESITVSGTDRVLLMLEAAADPDRVARNVEVFGTEVLPAVRERLGSGTA